MSSTHVRNKVLLIIMDGLGAAPASKGNAVSLANPTNLIRLWDSYPHTYLEASGSAVGLPDGVYGNSEVGHTNIGAGKVILQNLPKINRAIETGAFFNNNTLLQAVAQAHNNNSNIHVMGNLSNGGVHSHIDHFLALIDFMKSKGYRNGLYFHCFTDGRDAGQRSANEFLKILDDKCRSEQMGKIVSIIGRAYAMDRNLKWDRTEKAYRLIAEGKGEIYRSWNEVINKEYEQNRSDEYFEPSVISPEGKPYPVEENDALIFMNFRADRALQISDAFVSHDFNAFQRKSYSQLLFLSIVPYRKDFPENTIFPRESVSLSLGRLLADNNKRQLRIAESEKFPHVTYFFNGGNALKFNGEDRIEVPSPSVPTYDMKPEMSAMEVFNILKDKILQNTYDFILLNLANTDMVGHTGNLEACIKSVQVVDHVVSELVKLFTSQGGISIITADHGNVEEVIKLDTGDIDTEHSLNPVPFIIVDRSLGLRNLPYGKLSDITPTILNLMGINQPEEMGGKSLI